MDGNLRFDHKNKAMSKVLLVDDDQELCGLLADYLESEGFLVECAHDGPGGLACIRASAPDLVVLDIMLPGMSGLDVLRQLRPDSTTPVLMLTARGDDVDRIVGLELGADDYLPKPCNPRELVARIRAVLRRSTGSASEQPVIEVNDLVLNSSNRTLKMGDTPLELTSTEFTMLEILMRHAGTVVTKEQLSEEGLGRPLGRFDRSIDMHLSNLRRKLGPGPDGEHRLDTVRGVGYQLRVLAE